MQGITPDARRHRPLDSSPYGVHFGYGRGMREYADAVPVSELADRFVDPPRRFGPIAFWFLNDRCDPDALLEQLDQFAAAGFGGICPCARVGLDPEIGYLTARWFEVLDVLMARCRELGLQVILYDEASYPSGSANGAVVAANPEHMARGLSLGDSLTITDGVSTSSTDAVPGSIGRVGYWRPSTGRSLVDRLVAVIAGQLDGNDRVRVDTVRALATGDHHLIRLDPGEFPGRWRLLALFDVPSGGRIRGAYAHGDDGSPLAPAASNLLDPAAVGSFLALTHEAYERSLGQWFGDPIVGWFTDEPNLLGRGHRTDVRAWSPELLDDLRDAGPDHGDPVPLLGSLFVEYDDDLGFPDRYADTVTDRLSRVYYGAQRQWCDAHGLALTGHPSAADELTALDNFSWPGQDAVWRWVLPGRTALQGVESASARSAASVAEERGVRTVLTEALGAYGWRLTMDEVKWLLDWHLVRGTSTFLLHAFFASVRGNRAFESEPDLGLHNAWWPHLPVIATYLSRASMVLGSLQNSADVGVVVSHDHAPTDEVADLYRNQVTFRYVSAEQVLADPGRFRAVAVTADLAAGVVQHLRDAGVTCQVLDGSPWWREFRPSDVTVLDGPGEDLRLSRWRPDPASGPEWSFITNEGEQLLTVTTPPDVELWDCWTGRRWRPDGQTTLGRRQSLVIVPAPATRQQTGQQTGSVVPAPPPVPLEPTIGITNWRAVGVDGQAWPGPALGDWVAHPELETWSGSIRCQATVDLPATPPGPVRLDLGVVGDLARVEVNGEFVAELLWAPYVTVIPAGLLQAGNNTIEVLVSNSSANTYEGAMRPSGLIGPVTLG